MRCSTPGGRSGRSPSSSPAAAAPPAFRGVPRWEWGARWSYAAGLLERLPRVEGGVVELDVERLHVVVRDVDALLGRHLLVEVAEDEGVGQLLVGGIGLEQAEAAVLRHEPDGMTAAGGVHLSAPEERHVVVGVGLVPDAGAEVVLAEEPALDLRRRGVHVRGGADRLGRLLAV